MDGVSLRTFLSQRLGPLTDVAEITNMAKAEHPVPTLDNQSN